MDAGREETPWMPVRGSTMDAAPTPLWEHAQGHRALPAIAVPVACHATAWTSRATSTSRMDRSPCSLAIGEGRIEQRHLLPLDISERGRSGRRRGLAAAAAGTGGRKGGGIRGLEKMKV